jgi:PAS domain S-box-containing protein
MSSATRTVLVHYGGAVGLAAAAVLVRWVFDPYLRDTLPFVTLFGAVAAAVWFSGYRPAVLVVVFGYLACAYLFAEPRGTIGFNEARNPAGLIAYFATCAIIIGFGEALHVARRRADQQRESLRVTVTSMGDAVITTDAVGRVTSLNPVATDLTGWTQDEAAGRPLDEVFHIINEHSRQTVENPLKTVLAKGKIVGLASHTVLVAKDGVERPIEDSAATLRDEHSEVLGVVLLFRDATERRAAEAAAQKHQEVLALVHHIGKIGHWEWNSLTDENKWSPEIEALYGLEPGAFDGTYDAWAKLLHPDDLPKQEEVVRRALETGQYFTEFRVVWPDGSVHWLEARANVFKDGHDKPVRIMGVNMDVTERKRAEEALRQAMEQLRIVTDSMAAPVTRCSRDFKYLWVSKPYADWINRPVNEIVGRPILDVIGPRAFARLLPCFQQVLSGQVVRYEDQIHFQGIGPRWVSAVYTPTLDSHGVPDGWVAVVNDLTERKRMEVALSEADRHKDEFLATLAHELRNPLAPIRNGIEILHRADGKVELVEQARGILGRQFDQLVRLVDDLLDMSRIRQGKVQVRKEVVELVAIVQSAVEAVRPLVDAKAQKLTVTLPPDAIYLDADPARLAQVVSNLLHNAAKYTEKRGHIWLTVECRGNKVLLSVRDTGVGIAAEHLPRLFEMFSQVTPALERSHGGLGIGLSLVRGLVELHGGSVEARSDGAGKGSEFIVRLPVVGAPAPPATGPSDGAEKPCAGPKHRILVVDDNRDTADSMAMTLEMMGHPSRTAYDGLEAVQSAASFRPEVVLLDIGLPKLNGYDAARRIREQPWGKDMILIALTGWGQEADKRRASDAGFDHHLTKPVKVGTVLELLTIKHAVPQG